MNWRRFCCFILLSVTLWPVFVAAQADVHFSQFYETSIIRNPALVGVFTDNFKITGYVRNQWSSITSPYQTALGNGEYRLTLGNASNDFLSFGILGFMDKAGEIDEKLSGIYPAINYNKCLNSNDQAYLSLGFTGGYMQYSFDPTKATFNNQFIGGYFSPSNPTKENLPVPNFNYTDLGIGLNFNITPAESKGVTYIVGASGYHFNQPLFSYYHTVGRTLAIRWNVNGAIIKELNEKVVVQLQGNYARQGSYEEIIAGGLIGWRSVQQFSDPSFEIYGGAFYRNQDAIIPAIKLKYKNVSIGFSYDVNISSLKEASSSQGGFEITMSVSGNYPPLNGVNKKTVCPRF